MSDDGTRTGGVGRGGGPARWHPARRRRGGDPGDRPTPVEGPGREDRPLTEGELRELLGRAGRGDLTVLPALRRLLDAAPHLWRYAGDVARHAEAAWIDLLAGRDLLVRESLTRSVAALKAELAGPGAPPLERLLAERVAANWLQASQADAAFAQLKGRGPHRRPAGDAPASPGADPEGVPGGDQGDGDGPQADRDRLGCRRLRGGGRRGGGDPAGPLRRGARRRGGVRAAVRDGRGDEVARRPQGGEPGARRRGESRRCRRPSAIGCGGSSRPRTRPTCRGTSCPG